MIVFSFDSYRVVFLSSIVISYNIYYMLYFSHALSQGFIHEFFYTFRYFLSANDLFLFLCNKFSSSILSDRVAPSPAAVCVKRRCLDLIQTWISGYFTVDFVANAELAASMYSFIQEHVSFHDVISNRTHGVERRTQ